MTHALLQRALLLAIAASAAACKAPVRTTEADLNALAADESQGVVNQFLIFGSPGQGEDFLPAIKLDVAMLPPLFQHPRVGFATKSFYDMTYDEVIEETERHARGVAERGTLVWFFSGHGYDAGEMMIQDEVLKFPHIAQAIKRARGNRPIKRLVVMVDACYSGNLVDGATPITRYDLTGTEARPKSESEALTVLSQNLLDAATATFASGEAGFGLAGTLFEELIILTSASKSEMSNSSATSGSQMVRALAKTLGDVTTQNANMSIDQFLKSVSDGTTALNAGQPVAQTPLYRVLPATVGATPFESGRAATPP